jgi:hypothetical protein
MAGALLITYSTTSTSIIVEFITVALTQFNDSIFGAGAKAAVTFKAVTTAKATLGFKSCF